MTTTPPPDPRTRPTLAALTDRRNDPFLASLAAHAGPVLARYFGAEVRGLERWPAGGALVVGNHSGGMSSPDSWIFGAQLIAAHGVVESPFALAHDAVFKVPGMRHAIEALGGVPAAAGNAQALLQAGRKVLVYPGGDVDAMRPWRQRHTIQFGGRRGYVRLAMAAGVPIVPVVAAGSHSGFYLGGDLQPLLARLGLAQFFRLKTWPVGVSFPWGVTLGPPPPYLPLPTRILIEVLPPIELPHTGADAAQDDAMVAACDLQIRSTMEAALAVLLRERAQRGRLAARDWWRAA